MTTIEANILYEYAETLNKYFLKIYEKDSSILNLDEWKDFGYIQKRLEMRKDCFCTDCQKDLWYHYGKYQHEDFYMLKHKLWESIASVNEQLCISCSENRLNRPIVKEDLLEAIVNKENPRFKGWFL